MKYWYFKGADVVGPFSVAEVVNDADFSADTFVCPENESANSEAWKSADQYMEDFGYFLDPINYPNPPSPEPKPSAEEKPAAENNPERENSAASAEQSAQTPIPADKTPKQAAEAEAETLADKTAAVAEQVQPEVFPSAAQAEQERNIGQEQVQAETFEQTLQPQADAEQEPLKQEFVAASPEENNFTAVEQPPLTGENTTRNASDFNVPEGIFSPKGERPAEQKNLYSEQPLQAAEETEAENKKTSMEDFSPEETVHARSPLNAAMDDNLLDEIPAGAAVLSSSEEPRGAEIEEISLSEEDEKSGEQEIVFDERTTSPKEDITPTTVLRDISKSSQSEEDPFDALQTKEPVKEEIPLNGEANPGRKVLKDAQSLADNLKFEKPLVLAEEEQKKEAEEEPDDSSLDTFTVSLPVMRIAPDSETAEKEKLVREAAKEAAKKEQAEKQPRREEKPKEEPKEDFSFNSEDEIPAIFTDKNTANGLNSSDSENLPNHGILGHAHKQDDGLLSIQNSVNNQFIKPAPTTTGNILNSSNGHSPDRKNKKNDLIYIMVMALFLLIIIACVLMFKSENDKEDNPPAALPQPAVSLALPEEPPVNRSILQGLDEGVPSPDVSTEGNNARKNALPQQTNSALKEPSQEKDSKELSRYCENLVRNYILSDGNTLENYFDKLYGGAYQTRWSCNPLYADRYVGEFFASKVRSEPIRYMFSVDVKSGKIGGMNDVAVELLTKK